MSATKDCLLNMIYELSEKTGYSDDFLLCAFYHYPDYADWGHFYAAALKRQWQEVTVADAVWMITVSPDCKEPVVRCSEMEMSPHPFAVSITSKTFEGLSGLVKDALEEMNVLRNAEMWGCEEM